MDTSPSVRRTIVAHNRPASKFVAQALTQGAFQLVVTFVRTRLLVRPAWPGQISLFLGILLLGSSVALGQRVPVTEKTLPNGMKLLLVERHDDPTIAGGWVAHVGSANEKPGITGIAHLFEHMMFKGTPTLGTKDYKKDLEIISEQEKVREDIRREEVKMRAAYRNGEIDDLLKPENKTPRS